MYIIKSSLTHRFLWTDFGLEIPAQTYTNFQKLYIRSCFIAVASVSGVGSGSGRDAGSAVWHRALQLCGDAFRGAPNEHGGGCTVWRHAQGGVGRCSVLGDRCVHVGIWRSVVDSFIKPHFPAACWSRGRIPALGAGGPGFESRTGPYLTFLFFYLSKK